MGLLEAIVSPFIKDIMGKFFSNFDSSKLDIGYSGTVDLSNMLIRPGVMDDFGVPLKLVFGKVGKISIQIALTSLVDIPFYANKTRDVAVELKDVYILLAPPASVPYTPPNHEQDVENKRKALEKALSQDPDLNVVPVATGDTSSAMVMGIINNIKVNVENIHIRYEDNTTRPDSPFAFGLVLTKLSVVSANDKWIPTPTDKTAETFFKLVSLEGLGIYWNSNCSTLRPNVATPEAESESIDKMVTLLGDKNHELRYIFGPLKAQAKAIVTMKPNRLAEKFSKPLADVVLCMESIDINLTNEQFHDALLLMESLEDTARKQPFLAYRPFDVPFKGNAKKWWKYAYTCARVGVQRRSRLYDPTVLLKEKRLIDEYELVYGNYRQQMKLDKTSDAEKLLPKLQNYEDQISNQDILIVRKRVAFKDKEVGDSQKVEKGWWGKTTKIALDPAKLKEILSEKLTPEEMKEIQEYINLDPADADAQNFPPRYVQIKFDFNLPKVAFKIQQVKQKLQDLDVFEILSSNFSTKMEMYPAEKGMWVELGMGQLAVTGVDTGGEIPCVAKSITTTEDKNQFFAITYSKNPPELAHGQHIAVRTERLEVTYDAPTVLKLLDCFTWPSGVELKKTTKALGNAMENAKNMSANGITEMIENTDEIYLDVHVKAPYLMIPSGGSMKKADTILVFNMGDFIMKTTPRERSVTDGKAIELVGDAEGDVSEAVLKLTYNQYTIEFKDIEVLVALKGEDIMAAINHTFPPDAVADTYHYDRPASIFNTGSIIICLNQCIITNDPRFPQFKIEVTVPLVDFQITNYRVLKLVRLILTTPLPVTSHPQSSFIDEGEDPNFSESELDKLISERELALKDDTSTKVTDKVAYNPETAIQFTTVIFDIHINSLKVLLLRFNEEEKSTTPILNLELIDTNARFKYRTFGLTLDVFLGGAKAAYLDAKMPGVAPGSPVYFINSPDYSPGFPLIKIHFFSISEACPHSAVGDIRQKAVIDVTAVDFILHQQSIEALLAIGDRIMDEFIHSDFAKGTSVYVEQPKPKPKPKAGKGGMAAMIKALGIKNLQNSGDILLKATIVVSNVSLSLTSEKLQIAKFELGQLVLDYEDRPYKSRVFTQITGIGMLNLDTPTLYTKVMLADPNEPFGVGTVTLHKETIKPTEPDIEVTFKLACPQIILLGDYVGNILDFFSHVQLARESFKNAADATSKVAVSAVKDAYQTEKKLLLDLKIQAPKLIIVRNNLSTEAVVVDLGDLTVKNNLSAVKAIGTKVAVVDNMSLSLVGISVSRVIMDSSTQTIKAELHLLEPVAINLTLARNLSPWFTKLTSIDVSGELQPTVVKFSTHDVEIASSILLGYVNRVTKSLEAVKSAVEEDKTDPEAEADEDGDLVGAEAQNLLNINVQTIGAKLKILQIGINIYQTATLLDGSTGIVQRDVNASLGEFYLQLLELELKLWNNKDVEAEMILNEILLRDTRPTTSDIKDFIVKKESPDSKNAPVFQLSFAMKHSEDSTTSYTVNLTNQGLAVIFYLEYIKLLVDFGIATANSIPRGEKDNTIKIEDVGVMKLDKKKPNKLVGGSNTVEAGTEKAEGDEEEKEPGFELPLIKAEVNFHSAEFIFLENLNSTETNAVIAYGDSSYKMDSEKGQGSKGSGQWHFGIVTAIYVPDGENEQVCDVLEPTDAKFSAEVNPQSGTLIDIDISRMFLHINAGTILLIAKIVKELQKVVAESTQSATTASETCQIDFTDVWSPKKNSEQAYWFLNLSALTNTVNRQKQAATENAPLVAIVTAAQNLPESVSLKMNQGMLILEAGVGSKPTPMLLLEGYIKIEAKNWTTNLGVSGTTGGCIYYNNVTNGTWEYFLEPNAVNNNFFGEPEREPWGMEFSMIQKPKVGGKTPRVITVSSDDMAEVTISKTSVDLFKALAENFINSISNAVSEADVNTPPYVFLNDTGTDVYLELNSTVTALLRKVGGKVVTGRFLVKQGESVDMGMELQDINEGDQKDRSVALSIPKFSNFEKTISVQQNGASFFQIKDNNGRSCGMLVEIKAQRNFSTLIVARSVLEIKSSLSAPVDVTAVVGSVTTTIGRLEPYKAMNFPFPALCDGVLNVALKFTPPGYKTSTTTKALTALAKSSTTITDVVVSKSVTSGPDGKIRVIGNVNLIAIDGAKGAPSGRSYLINLKPPLIVSNFFSVPLDISTDGKSFKTIPPGQPLDVLTADTEASSSRLTLKIHDFQGSNWSGNIRLSLKPVRSMLGIASDYIKAGEINSVEFKSDAGKSLFFRFRPRVVEEKLEELSFFSPYWIINRTGLALSIQGASSRSTRVNHAADEAGPVMMAYDVDGNDKAKFSIGGSETSSALNLEAAMALDFVCKGKDRDYEVVVSVELSTSTMTKLVSFLPKYIINNSCCFDVVVSESGQNGADTLAPANMTIPFWPKRRLGDALDLLLRVDGTDEQTSSFRFDGVNLSLLKLDNKYAGLLANVNVLETTGSLTITSFNVSEVPILLVNDTTNLDIEFHQAEIQIPRTICAGESVVFSWDDLNKPHEILWTSPTLKTGYGFPRKIQTDHPESGEFSVTEGDTVKRYSWGSFLSGFRTIFVLTETIGLLPVIHEYSDLGKSESEDDTSESIENVEGAATPEIEVLLQLEGIGLSLVNDEACKDILYLRLDGRLPIWEGGPKKGNKFRNLPLDQNIILEKGYVEYITGKNTKRPVNLEGNIKIDFSNFELFEPTSQQLRRHAYQPGISIRFKMFEYSTDLRFALGKLQIDNQLEGTEYPHILSMAPIPKSVKNKSEILPPLFILSYSDASQGTEAKSISGKVMLQEIRVAGDSTLIKNTIAVFTVESIENPSSQTNAMYQKDFTKASSTNLAFYKTESERISDESAFKLYKLLQIYKLKLQVTAALSQDPDGGYFQNLLLALGSATVSVSDVPLDVDGLEIKQKRWTKTQVLDAVIQHYKSGILQNVYKFVLGLDILGNPTRLVGGLTSGLTSLITEPLQGAMDGNLIEGISNGAEAALVGTVGGLTDALGTVTKQLGKLTTGLGLGVLGVPNLLGALSSGLLSIGHVGGDKNEVETIRPRRIMTPDTALDPYSLYDVIGKTVYKNFKSQHSDCGKYVEHFLSLNQGNWEVLLLTVNRVSHINTSRSLGSIHENWTYKWVEVVSVVQDTATNEIVFKQPKPAFSLGLTSYQQSARMYTKEMLGYAYPKAKAAWKTGSKK